jgi:hypothetical protein
MSEMSMVHPTQLGKMTEGAAKKVWVSTGFTATLRKGESCK